MSVPIGPLHPALKEPLRIKLEAEGERVINAEVDLGYVHRGIEKAMVGKTWQDAIYLSSRVCGICSGIHNMNFVETLEEIVEVDLPERAKYLRVIINELDRIQSHLIGNMAVALGIEHETLALWMLDIREDAMNLIEEITGHRAILDWARLGGVRLDVDPDVLQSIPEKLENLQEKNNRYKRMFESGPVALRTKGIGYMSKKEAEQATGPIARASGVKFDWRFEHPTYQELDFSSIYREGGDVLARTVQRFEEINQSIELIEKVLDKIEPGPVREYPEMIEGEAEHRGEAPRGELTYYVKTDEEGKIKDATIRTPSVLNVQACVDYMMGGAPTIADAVAIYESVDPCIACLER
ncbi:hypothetical protein AKJ50_02155 [candidate division MSBL1 archaeon SCGC-AAA382A13]|uniref:NADH-quinone oxidoreductase subunit D domain-containing protein n=1 Tax=candidate division MSBL1 archaeon SCGC-AAA382A13 TaxID=1698279 RepID=A0A133VDZ9_9EURY|nr:hypothetical protein AKJ50_02155 [candidate division MSBL1 archaeon SCGC-AAA382A13]